MGMVKALPGLVNIQTAIENGHLVREVSRFTIHSMVIFHSFLYVYRRVYHL